MLTRVQILREAITRVVEILASRKIKVIQRGLIAKVEYNNAGVPIAVYVPYVPDDASEELCDAIQGFVDHEIGHVLDSDPAALKKARALNVQALHNIVEDVYVEAAQEKRFRGAAYNLDRTRQFFINKVVIPGMADPERRKQLLLNCALRAWGGQLPMINFMADKWGFTDGLNERVPEEFKGRLRSMRSSHDALALTLELKKILTEPEAPEEKGGGAEKGGSGSKTEKKEKPTKSSKGGEEKEKPKESAAGDEPPPKEGKADEEARPEEKPDDEQDGKEGDDVGPGGAEGEGGEEADSPPGGSSGRDSATDGEDGDADEGDGEKSGAGEGGESDAGAAEPYLSDDDLAKVESFDDALSDAIRKDTLESIAHQDYLIFSRDFDRVVPMEQLIAERGRVESSKLREYVSQIEDEYRPMVGAMQKDIERILASRSLSSWEAGRRSGRLNGASLHRLAVGDDRVFRRRIDGIKMETALTILVDASGSMSGSRIHVATSSALALSDTLDRLKIPHEVIAFTTAGCFPSSSGFAESSRELSAMGKKYGRSETILMPILKSFNDRLTDAKRDNFAALPMLGILNQNPDGECLIYAAERLRQRPERRKVMLTLSDGEPCCPGDYVAQHFHLKHVVDKLNSEGIETVGIGIQTDAVAGFYSKHVVIDKLSDMPTAVMRQLANVLL
ncbi:hypothetical protein [Chromobacterium sp. ASV23]|uniref:cobaltochelatase CobT-related protein n=1 Tax=Chromobacterium sp. ASV23 TaxID=2795110 RepID=UPI0018EC9E06|nr:hypothetical protein [Chromobacterium sp. ASV23]